MLDSKETIRNLDEKSTQSLGDPFAVDFFGSSVSQIEELAFYDEEIPEEITVEPDSISVRVPKTLWADYLPKLSKDEVKFSNSFQFLPVKLSNSGFTEIESSLSHFIFGEANRVLIQVVDNREVKLCETFSAAETEQSIFISIIAEPGKHSATLVLDSVFASQIVDKTLGELGLTKLVRRKLSRTEETVAEFLAVCLLGDMNEKAGESLFRVSSVEQNFPSWFEIKQNKERLRGMDATVRLEIGDAVGNAHFIYPTGFLQELNQYDNPLLKRNTESDALQKYKQIVFELESKLLVGTTNFTVKEAAGLEEGDFIVLEESFIEWNESILSANSYFEFADNFRIYGEVEPQFDGKLRITVKDILTDTRHENTPERIKMDTEFNDEFESDNEDVSVVLDNVMLNINIVLAGRKMNLEELSRLRNGQIIELGCKATDAVELQTDGKKIAVGELVDIEGNLGVRLTKTFV
jgi:flagellar motor switch/type III secretory pathway protein FliN